MSCVAWAAGIDLPDCAPTSPTKSASPVQAPAVFPAASAVWTACTSSARLVPGPTPCTLARSALRRWPAVGVGVAVGVLVGVAVGVLVGVAVGVLVGVAVGVLVGVAVGVLVGVFVGVLVGAGVGVSGGV